MLPEPSIFILSCWVRTLLAKVGKKGWSHYGHMTHEELVTGSEKVSHFDFKIHRALVGISGTATGSSQGYSRAIFPAEANGSSTRSCEAGESSNSC